MYLYRVEAEDGNGPWCDAKGDWSAGKGAGWCDGAVAVHYAALKVAVSRRDTMRWGFSNMEQLFIYMLGDYSDHTMAKITENLLRMKQYGLGISVFDRQIAEVVGDHTQIVFSRNDARRIAWLQPDDEFILRSAHLYIQHCDNTRMLFKRAA